MKHFDPGVTAGLLAMVVGLSPAYAQTQGAVLSGIVREPDGQPQLGALVEVLGPSSVVVAHAYTDDHGRYLLAALTPGRYQLRATAAFLAPLLRKNVLLVDGAKTLADFSMTALFAVDTWFPVQGRGAREPADDWRWTLRSSAERPLLRLAGDEPQASGTVRDSSGATEAGQSTLDRTEVILEAGQGGMLKDGLDQAFSFEVRRPNGAVASVGMVAHEAAGAGAEQGFSVQAGYGRAQAGTGSEFHTVVQAAMLPEIGTGQESGLQVVNVASGERFALGDLVTIDAGTLLSAERLLGSRVNAAPFLRFVVHPSPTLAVMYRFAEAHPVQSVDDLQSDQGQMLQSAPLVDSSGRWSGNPGTHQELAVAHITAKDVTRAAVYQDAFVAGYLEGSGLTSVRTESTDDLSLTVNRASGTFLLATPGYVARGVQVAWTHRWAGSVQSDLEGSYGTALSLREGAGMALRSAPGRTDSRSTPAIAADVKGNVQRTGTTFEARYRWQPESSLSLVNPYDSAENQAYLGLLLKQRLWSGRQFRRVSAVVEASNLLEQGYQPVIGPDGETLFLAQVPRNLQAGLSFSF